MITIRKACKPKDDCDDNDHLSSPPQKNHPPSTIKILTICLIIATISYLCYYIIFKACHAFRTRRRTRHRTRITTTHEINTNETHHHDVINQDHEPVVFHPIWLINTIGLDQSVINSIKMFKYKTEDGVDSDCAVCLGMFQEDESLRLLPACRHAFHVVCIDTWLRSHTNCPLCRAPVIDNTSVHQVARNSSTREEVSSGGSSNETIGVENCQEILDANGESSVKKLALVNGVRVQSDLTQNCCQKLEPLRRSISMGPVCFVDEESES